MAKLTLPAVSMNPVAQSVGQMIHLLDLIAERIDCTSGSPTFTADEHDLIADVVALAREAEADRQYQENSPGSKITWATFQPSREHLDLIARHRAKRENIKAT